jgi:hypothetical protein
MGTTPKALYRRGNATIPRMDNVRPIIDIAVINQGGVDWVLSRSGGVSCYDYTPPPGSGPIWELPAGTTYPDDLYLRDDQNGHWNWEPENDMTLAAFRALLVDVGRNFAKVLAVGGSKVSP